MIDFLKLEEPAVINTVEDARQLLKEWSESYRADSSFSTNCEDWNKVQLLLHPPDDSELPF